MSASDSTGSGITPSRIPRVAVLLLIDVVVIASVVGGLFFADGSAVIGGMFAAFALGGVVGIAGWLRRRRPAKPLTLLASVGAFPATFFMAMGALNPFSPDYDGPVLTSLQSAAHVAGFLLVVANIALVLAAMVLVAGLDTGKWLGEPERPAPGRSFGALVTATGLVGFAQFGAISWEFAREWHWCTVTLVAIPAAIAAAFAIGAKRWWDRDPRARMMTGSLLCVQVLGALFGALALFLAADSYSPPSTAKQTAYAALFSFNVLLPVVALFAAEFVNVGGWFRPTSTL